MTPHQQYPKRLIEVDLPIARISAHSRREKSIRHGHISTLHIWWARRPLAACRSVILAALWPDPAPGPDDPPCPPGFIDAARSHMLRWAHDCAKKAGPESFGRLTAIAKNPALLDDPLHLRTTLLDFIADFANWDNSTDEDYLETARALVLAAHEALGGEAGTRPLVVDPFAGGGSIPLEALRVGADAFASDLNPVAVLLNKVVLEYIPKYRQRLADEVRKRGEWIKREAEKELAAFYPKAADGATPIAYLWARTIQCEGPDCGAKVPLIRSLWLTKKADRQVALQLVPDRNPPGVAFRIIIKKGASWVDQEDHKRTVENPQMGGTVKRGSATCPCCGYTTPAEKARRQFVPRSGGADDSRLIAVIFQNSHGSGIEFRLGSKEDEHGLRAALAKCAAKEWAHAGPAAAIPDETLPYLRSIFNINLLGVDTWGKLFNGRQMLSLLTLVEKTRLAAGDIRDTQTSDDTFADAVALCLAFAVDRCADYWSSLAVWSGEFVAHTFGRQALGIVWDYAEVNGFADGSGTYAGAVGWICRVIEGSWSESVASATVDRASACQHPLPDDSAQAFITDPPYYDAVPYADLSDFFYVWLRRTVGDIFPQLLADIGTPKEGEIVQLSERNPIYAKKTREYFEALMENAMAEGRRVIEPSGVAVVVFAHKSTTGWESQIQAMIAAGWVVTASWPIDTERPGRLRANNSAALASSVHLVCRPRENSDGSVRTHDIGDWRAVLAELPSRLHAWMPQLSAEGVVGADAIFACLGPALEVFSRYSRVEKSSGEAVTLREYLEHVWAAVSNEALSVIFKDADAAGLEPDARLTAMWLWTVGAGKPGSNGAAPTNGDGDDEADEENGEEGAEAKKPKLAGFALEFDAARKIAQGLGVHLEKLGSLVEIKGETARLLPVAERTRYLFGKDSQAEQQNAPRSRKKPKQGSLFEELEAADMRSGSAGTGLVETSPGARPGLTVLDRIHQAMILFAAGRGEAMRRFLVDDGAGTDPRFWKLAQSLSALYPAGTDEKRWVDGVLARKKGLGFQA